MCYKFLQLSIGHHFRQGLHGKNLPAGGEDDFFHIFPPHPKTTSADTGDNFEFWLIHGPVFYTQFSKVLNACRLITGCAIIFGNFSFNYNLGFKFTGDYKIRGLIEPGNFLSTFGFTETYTVFL